MLYILWVCIFTFRDQHFVSQGWRHYHGILYFIVIVNFVLNWRIHLVNTGVLMCNEQDCLVSIVCRIIICYPSSHVIKNYYESEWYNWLRNSILKMHSRIILDCQFLCVLISVIPRLAARSHCSNTPSPVNCFDT